MAGKPKLLPATKIETERLILKPISPFSFARQTLHWTADGQALADLNMPSSGWTFGKWWKQMRKLTRRNRLTHGIWVKGQDRPIGMHMSHVTLPAGDAVTGILIGDKEWRGKGVAVEAKHAMISDLFERLNVHRVTSWVNARNFSSLHMTMQLGFKQEGQMREQAMLLDGSRVDFLGFGLLRSEWDGGKAGLSKEHT
jgi:RimJ/RimL family protein N-acetyltransferase